MKKKLYVTKCLSMICALVCTFSVLCGSAVAKEPGIELCYTRVLLYCMQTLILVAMVEQLVQELRWVKLGMMLS